MDNDSKSILSQYISDNLTPDQTERDIITELYNELRTILSQNCFQTGSYARFTANKPVHDLDVIWNLPPETARRIRTMLIKAIQPEDVDINDVLNDLKTKLEEEYMKLNRIVSFGIQSHSVTIEFDIPLEGGEIFQFSIDVVPGIELEEQDKFDENMFLIPEIGLMSKYKRLLKYESKERINWVKSDPRGYIEYARRMNEDNKLFRKITKFLKSWKRKQKHLFEDFKLKSFNIELIVASLIEEKGAESGISLIKEFFTQLPEFINEPHFVDFAYENERNKYIDDYLNEVPQNIKDYVLSKASEALTKIQTIQDDNDTKIIKTFDELTKIEEIIKPAPAVVIKTRDPYKLHAML